MSTIPLPEHQSPKSSPNPAGGGLCPVGVKRLLLHAAEASTSVRGYLRVCPQRGSAAGISEQDAHQAFSQASDIAENLGQLLALAADLIRHDRDLSTHEPVYYPRSLFVAPLLLQMRHASGVLEVELNEEFVTPNFEVQLSSPSALLRLLRIATSLALGNARNASIVLHIADSPCCTGELMISPVLLSACGNDREGNSRSCESGTASASADPLRGMQLDPASITHAQHTIMWLANLLGATLELPAHPSQLWRLSLRTRGGNLGTTGVHE